MRAKLKSIVLVLGLSASSLAFAAEPAPATPAPPPAAAAAPAPPAWPPSVADFAQIDFVEDAHISPNGQYLAGAFGIGGRQVIGMMAIVGTDHQRVVRTLPDKVEAQGVMWVNDETILVPVVSEQEVDSGENWYISRAISLSRTSGKVQRLLWDLKGQNAADVVWLPHDGSDEVLMAGQDSIYDNEDYWPAVYRVNVTTGKAIKTLPGWSNTRGWTADGQGTVRLAWRYDDQRRSSALLYRGEQGSQFKTIDRADHKLRESVIEPVQFLPGTDHAVVIHDDDHGHSQLFEMDLTTRNDVRTVYTAPAGQEVGSALVSRDGTTLLGAHLAGAHGRTVWLDPAMATLQEQFDKAVGDRRATILSFSADRSKLLVKIDRPNWPGALYYYDTNVGALQRLANMNAALGNRALSPVKLIQYKARDGLEIEAVLTLPQGRAAKNLPVIVLPHGGPWAYDGLDYDYWPQFLASRGYAVIQPNFRGSTGYGTEFERKGEGQMGLAMQDDVSDALAWAAKEGIADPKRACIVGASYGGYAAMWGIVKDPDLYRCAISIAGVSNVRRDQNDFHSLDENSAHDAWKRMTPDFAAVSPINAVARIKVPLLLIHGKKDARVAFRQSTAMEAKMKAAGKAVELLLLPEADHHFGRQADREALLGAMEAFLKKYNPAG